VNRREFLAAAAAQAARPSAQKLNFIFILIDDLGWHDVGFTGSKFFETALPTSCLTAISCSIRNRCRRSRNSCCRSTKSPLPMELKAIGYTTAAIGKWHRQRSAHHAARSIGITRITQTRVGVPARPSGSRFPRVLQPSERSRRSISQEIKPREGPTL